MPSPTPDQVRWAAALDDADRVLASSGYVRGRHAWSCGGPNAPANLPSRVPCEACERQGRTCLQYETTIGGGTPRIVSICHCGKWEECGCGAWEKDD